MDTGMRGAVALITGASGDIGAEIARFLAAEGVHLALHCHRNIDAALALQAEAVVAQVRSVVVQADLTEEGQVERMWNKAQSELGPIKILIANAGIYRAERIPIKSMSLAQWNDTLQTNLTAFFLCFREFFKSIEQHKLIDPSAVMVGSMSGVWGDMGHCDYAASKAAITSGLLPTLKDELVKIAPQGRINAVAPGFIDTQMIAGVKQDKAQMRRVLQTASLRRVGTVQDVAGLVTFLASNRLSAHMTGEIVRLKGGKEGRILFDEDEIEL
ncbi:MAG: SDR family oxidoreductase [Candidimonas sp.]|nr:MAG: SDR family oxidoreductase [Candidimonas sp.]TAM19596.1 MAG: SDR family oxidoreductase [Candidimonas sp.]